MKGGGSEIRSRWEDKIKMDIKEIIYESIRVCTGFTWFKVTSGFSLDFTAQVHNFFKKKSIFWPFGNEKIRIFGSSRFQNVWYGVHYCNKCSFAPFLLVHYMANSSLISFIIMLLQFSALSVVFSGSESNQGWPSGGRARFESESSGQGLYMLPSKCNSYIIIVIMCNKPSIFFCHILIDHMYWKFIFLSQSPDYLISHGKIWHNKGMGIK